MAASVVLVTGPASSGKSDRLLAEYREQARRGIGSALWLAPTERARDAIRAGLVGPGGAVVAPHLFTFPDFARHLVRAAEPTARPLPEVYQRLLLDEVLAAAVRGGDVPDFAAAAETRGFAGVLFDFLTELKGQGVSPAEFAEAARLAAGGDERRAGKTEQVARLYDRYQRRLAERRMLDRQATYDRARALWAAGRLQPFASVRALFVDGFTDFTRPQFELLATVARTVERVWVTVPADAKGERTELFSRPRDTLDRLRRLTTDVSEVSLPARSSSRPAALAHLEETLFRATPPRRADTDGLELIEAPGMLGEVRMVARAVKALLLDGVSPDDVVVTARELAPYADLVREVFDEFGIPASVDGTDPLTRNPAVATLFRAARLANDGFPFAATTALLRSTYVRPDWPEVAVDPDVAAHAELLLRRLGEPHGRDAYLGQARTWAAEPQAGLEDEEAEQSRRRRKHELAKRCLPFLERFFRSWDLMPDTATWEQFAEWLRGLAAQLGVESEAQRTDAGAWRSFWAEVDGWAAHEQVLHSNPPRHTAASFERLLGTLAASAGTPRTLAAPGRVRFGPAEQARHLDCEHLFVLGLGERSFPNLGSSDPLYDDAERQSFRGAGVAVRCASDRLPDEMLLFYQLVTRPRRRLVLSYPAIDEKGQALLPGAFLTAAMACFGDDAVPVERRRMLIDGYDRDRPLSPAEYRVRWAATGATDTTGLSADLGHHLRAAEGMARARFASREYSPYDGLLRSPGVLADVRERFGPDRLFSPTALESYVACPFRFFLDQVLSLEPLEDPGEEVEHTRRGAAVHRALSRLHRRLKAEATHAPTPGLDKGLITELRKAVDEYAARGSSPASRMLWRLECQRLERTALRYGGQWEKFQEGWRKSALDLRPHEFELDFGTAGEQSHPALTIQVDGVEVRVGGRIDRVDLVDLDDGSRGFWVIDYKTGRSAYHTAADVQSFHKLQLALYAVAVERVIHAGARPLGIAYWLVADGGPKVALPKGRSATAWLTAADQWPRFREQLERWVATLVGRIRGGEYPLKPRSVDCTETCPYGQVCRITQSRSVNKEWDFPLPANVTNDE